MRIFTYTKGTWRTTVDSPGTQKATRTAWWLSADLDAWEGDDKVFSRHLEVPIGRDLG